jgi:hypothetical protein
MKLYVYRLSKLVILFCLSIILLKVIPFVPINGYDSCYISLAFVMLYSLFEILTPSYTIIVDESKKNIKII